MYSSGYSYQHNAAQGIFICPAHGSEYNKQGQVIAGPAALPLHEYNVAVNGTSLTVSA
ncbi:MAG: Rieske 2Fe-2S domain-containing protein [Bacteroidetes bacterium]|nr:Rieske 2Fe-2S domain-containing protein [Bacteroidota bacterium]